jgi:putative DNA primase/helicase
MSTNTNAVNGFDSSDSILSESTQTCQDLFKPAQSCQNLPKVTQTYSHFFLNAKNQADIQARGLLDDWSRATCRTVDKEEASFLLGYEAKSGGIWIGGETLQGQFRPDKPWRREGDKKAPKCRTPLTDHGCDAIVPTHPTDKNYWEPENLKKVCYQINGHPCLIISEGDFKAIAGCSNDLPTIGLIGVEMGLTGKKDDVQGKRYLIPTLEKYARAGFGFIFTFDADATINPNVNWAQRKLGHQLLKFNVPVYVATGNWEMGENGETKGMDDLIQKKGIEAFRKALSAATDFKVWESETFDKGDGDGTGKYLVSKNTTFEVHCRKTLFSQDWFVSDGGAFFQDCGTHWQLREDADVAKAIGDFAEECYQMSEVGKNYKFGTSKHLEAALKYCRRTLHKKDKPANRHLKAFLNGTVDTKTGKLQPHNKEDYLLECSPYNYVENAPLPNILGQFLLSSFGESQIPTIRAFMSALLDPTAPFGRFPHFIGNSGDGKGTVLRVMENLVGSDSSSSSQDFSELGKPEGRYQLLLGKSFFYIPDTGGFQSGLKAFYELVDNGPMSGRALYMPKAIQKKWNVRFAVASVEHLPIEHAGDGWDRRCIPIPTIKSTGEVDADLGQKLSEELGEIAGWALSMDKLERDNILTLPVSNPVLLSLKQEGAIIGDGVKSFVDRCFVPGAETHYGSDLHSWYQAYCKAHTLSPLSYQKFIQRLQRVLSKQWRPSEVIWMDGKAKRQSACWEGLRVLPCFLDLALNEDDDNQPSSRPHIPNWICVKENCQDGGLTDLTATLQTLTPEKNAETIDLHTLHTLHTQSLRNTEISHEMNGDCIEENTVSDESESKVCKARLTPTFEPVDDGCKVGKVCKEGDWTTPAEFAEQIRKAIANVDHPLAVQVGKTLRPKSELRNQVRDALTVEEFDNFRLLAIAGVIKGTRVKYVGKNAEHYEGEVLTVDDINVQNELACLRPDGKGYTTWLKSEDLRKL